MGSFSLLLALLVEYDSDDDSDDDDDDDDDACVVLVPTTLSDDGDDVQISLWSANRVRAPINLHEAPVQLSSSSKAFCPS